MAKPTADSAAEKIDLPDPNELSKTIADIAARSQTLVEDFAKRQVGSPAFQSLAADPAGLGKAFLELGTHIAMNPTALVDAQISAMNSYMNLWHHTAQRMLGQDPEPVVQADRGDRRFKSELWQENPVFDHIKQSYLISAKAMNGLVKKLDGMDDKTKRKVEFYAERYVDALSPSNFLMTNPEVLKATMETGGKNLLDGLRNVLRDLEEGQGELVISMTDKNAFELGKNVAVTPGKVVAQNDLMQLLHYEPTTKTVAKRPLVIIPPWINKFYILDLQPKNSFIKWATDQGHSVYVMSWVNPNEALAAKSFEDYMLEGPIAAMDFIEQDIGEKEFNFIGYCLGGTLLACTLAYLKSKGDDRIKSATFFTAMLDFTEPGDLGVFVDEDQLNSLESQMAEKGYLEGRSMANTFNLLRANDLIWSFVVNNYLLGKEPLPFDLLYWNSDSTRMPAKMHTFYLRNMYLENKLKDPGGIELAGVPIDLTTIDTPSYFISTREDHIAPWPSTFAGARLLSGPVRFTVGMSGHIAGVINPPASGKYGYWSSDGVDGTPETWLEGTEEVKGSWWPDWQDWIHQYADGEVPARVPGEGKLDAFEEAPGSFVKVRSGEDG